MKQCSLILIIWLIAGTTMAQRPLKLQGGFSYLEHFSIGGSFTFAGNHAIGILYGSNFFIRPDQFSSAMLQYQVEFPKLQVANLKPYLGVKGGYSVFTNKFYQWQLVALIPFVGAAFPINGRVAVFCETGVAVSHEIAVKRLEFGEIGNYKKVLPEIKAGLQYTLYRK